MKVFDVLIIGAGISGIGTGIRLLENNFSNFVILEKATDLGGTWRDNTYPGCECDVPSALYSYSFAQNPRWSRTFAGQSEILDYVRNTAEYFGIGQYIEYQQPVERAQWCEEQCLWVVRTADKTYHSRTLVTCSGYLHEPIVPDIPGLDSFSGTLFHSSRWRHDHSLNAERVAVIGTGASAIQFVPEIQPLVKQLSVFQRTPQWVLPKPNRQVTQTEKKLFGNSLLINAWRSVLFGGFETFGIGFRQPVLLQQIQKLAQLHLRVKVPDAELREKLTPDYTLGCKRVLMSNDYYPAVSQSNVSLHSGAVTQIRGSTVIAEDGSETDVDTIIMGTGFYVTEPPIAEKIFDGVGCSLSEVWQHKMQAYRGTTISGFPNAFMVLGPNLGIGHNSAFIVIEAQITYIMSALNAMRENAFTRMDVDAAVQQNYNLKVQKHLHGTVWNSGGCSSYYLDKNGFNSVGFPWSSFKMQQLLNRFDIENYHCVTLEQ